MSNAQPFRLDLPPGHALAGAAIDRSRPLRFWLNGRGIEGFAGDTVLSAVLASGIIAIGSPRRRALALTERFSPFIVSADGRGGAVPMARVPARNGADYVTLPHGKVAALGGPAAEWLGWPPRTFELDPAHLRQVLAADDPPTLECDVLVVGGGVAGMTAAVEAARLGHSVLLAERRTRLGGDALLFGRTEGEEHPDAAIARLSGEIAAHAGITVMSGTSVHVGARGRPLVHGPAGGGEPAWQSVAAGRIVLATGAIERLPVFAGNRLPGIVGAAEAFRLAHDYGVWPGREAVLATASNAPYRLAMLAADAGITMRRILDPRPRPQSRFIEFCKAYGITMAGGVTPVAVRPAGRGLGLALDTLLDIEGYRRVEPELSTERLIVNGGWQPDLGLWHLLGGTSRWDAEAEHLVAGHAPPGLVLAGAAAGAIGTRAAMDSGGAAIDRLFERPVRTVRESGIDPIYETPDAPCPVAPPATGRVATSYLDGGTSLFARPATDRKPGWFGRAGMAEPWQVDTAPQRLGLIDVVAATRLGLIAVTASGAVAAERVLEALVDDGGSETDAPLPAAPPEAIPPWLSGRFGPRARRWRIAALEPRRLEAGSLIFPDSDRHDPVAAMGVVLRPSSDAGGAVALLAHDATPGAGATLREQDRPIAVRLVGPIEE